MTEKQIIATGERLAAQMGWRFQVMPQKVADFRARRVKDRSGNRLDRATGLDPKGESLTPKGERPNTGRKSIGDVVI